MRSKWTTQIQQIEQSNRRLWLCFRWQFFTWLEMKIKYEYFVSYFVLINKIKKLISAKCSRSKSRWVSMQHRPALPSITVHRHFTYEPIWTVKMGVIHWRLWCRWHNAFLMKSRRWYDEKAKLSNKERFILHLQAKNLIVWSKNEIKCAFWFGFTTEVQ